MHIPLEPPRDSFTLAAVGDCLMRDPVSHTIGFAPLRELIRRADAAFGNLEVCLLNSSEDAETRPAEFGVGTARGAPAVAGDLKNMGLNLLSLANNHVMDFGWEGARQTAGLLDEEGLIYSGVGEQRSSALAARYLETGAGRIALISATSTFAPQSRAAAPFASVRARGGVNGLRAKRFLRVTHDEIQMLRAIRDQQLPGSFWKPNRDPEEEVELGGVWWKVASQRGFSYSLDASDEQEILDSVRAAKQQASFVVFSMHAHEPGNWSEEPADFLPALAHEVIDAGADAVVAHGPHRMRGIEIYRSRPVFYSLGNFIFQIDLLAQSAAEFFTPDESGVEASQAEIQALWSSLTAGGDEPFQSILAMTEFRQGEVEEIRLIPLELRFSASGASRGVPRLALGDQAQTRLELVSRLSEPFGTRVTIDQGIGRIRPKN
jgi:poly-gamma-glutamate synthesis protein (capsule biosynthesis protein)